MAFQWEAADTEADNDAVNSFFASQFDGSPFDVGRPMCALFSEGWSWVGFFFDKDYPCGKVVCVFWILGIGSIWFRPLLGYVMFC